MRTGDEWRTLVVNFKPNDTSGTHINPNRRTLNCLYAKSDNQKSASGLVTTLDALTNSD
jgi:hypothetical protein